MNRRDFDRFVADSTDGLLQTAYLIVWDLPEAEDPSQETLFKVAKRWPKVSRMDHPVAYARRILVTSRSTGAKRSRRRAELSEVQSGEPAAPARGARPALLPGPSRSRGGGCTSVPGPALR
ncbi:MAG: hypothetical protein ACR2MK_03810 [Solirubrobacteraceae bacterium]